MREEERTIHKYQSKNGLNFPHIAQVEIVVHSLRKCDQCRERMHRRGRTEILSRQQLIIRTMRVQWEKTSFFLDFRRKPQKEHARRTLRRGSNGVGSFPGNVIERDRDTGAVQRPLRLFLFSFGHPLAARVLLPRICV